MKKMIIEVSRKQLINLIMEALTSFNDISDRSVFGSGNYDIAEEYEAVDYDTVIDVLREMHWGCKEYYMVQSPSGQRAVRYHIVPTSESADISHVIASLKKRSTMPEGVKYAKIGKTNNSRIQPYFILSYIYNN